MRSRDKKLRWLAVAKTFADMGAGLGSGGPGGEWGKNIQGSISNLAAAIEQEKREEEAQKKRRGGLFGTIGSIVGAPFGAAGSMIGGALGSTLGGGGSSGIGGEQLIQYGQLGANAAMQKAAATPPPQPIISQSVPTPPPVTDTSPQITAPPLTPTVPSSPAPSPTPAPVGMVPVPSAVQPQQQRSPFLGYFRGIGDAMNRSLATNNGLNMYLGTNTPQLGQGITYRFDEKGNLIQ
ncbi:MAG: hypothetical protein WC098_06240 [Bacteroidales bacterium]